MTPPGPVDPRLIDLIGRLIERGPRDGAVRPPVIGVAGAQGCGKTTLARAAAARFGGAQLSLDDAYLARAERQTMARQIHPLFAVRGPPGTHDLGLLRAAIARLSAAGPDDGTPLPAFDKRADDRRPFDEWPVFRGRPAVVLIDGWCLGAKPQGSAALAQPVNALEHDHDPDGRWRAEVNRRLGADHAAFTAGLDALVFLRAPGFEVVLDWRCEQEAESMGLPLVDLPPADRARIAGFIQHFERVTRHMLAGGARADSVVALDKQRRILGDRQPITRI